MKAFIDGLKTGFFLQLAIGPLFFFVIGITLDSGFRCGLFGIIAITLVDFIYIMLSILGVGIILSNSRHKNKVNTISNIVLITFGIVFLYKGLNEITTGVNFLLEMTPLKSFITCFLMTISSPLTIVFWSSIFTSKAFEKQYKKDNLAIFGFGAGIMTFIFLLISISIVVQIGVIIPKYVIQFLNIGVGILIAFYGFKRLIRS